MPTGYTAGVADGKVTTFKEFALECARNFGALIMMQDDPLGTPIPEFEPSDYHSNALRDARNELDRLSQMTDAEVKAACLDEYTKELAYWEKCQAENAVKRQRYLSMLKKVESWTPPTSDHDGMKNFMLQQLTDSMKWDCPDKPILPKPSMELPSKWKAAKIAAAEHSIDYHTKNHAEEVLRTNERNDWVKALKESLS
jgi:hypothetical protein